MKKNLILIAATTMALFALNVMAADVIVPVTVAKEKPNFPLVEWSAAPGVDVKIENGSGASLIAQITVHGTEGSAGIKLVNCGDTLFIKAGSSAICTTRDPKNPVTFSSDSATDTATGTYQVRQQ